MHLSRSVVARARHRDAEAFVPLYARIEQHVRRRIASGEFGDGGRLPSEAQLAEHFRTTRVTVRHALAQLVFEGLVVREIGRGTFVAPTRIAADLDTTLLASSEAQMTARGALVTYQLIGFTRTPAPAAAARALGVAPRTPLQRLERVRLVDGKVAGLETRYFQDAVAARLPLEGIATRSMHQLIETALGVELRNIQVSISATGASGDQARRLGLRRGAPLLLREHTLLDDDSLPLAYGEALYRPEIRFRYRTGSRPSPTTRRTRRAVGPSGTTSGRPRNRVG
jgi:GntR family transcriptional regulator